jgi:hypothetical protein
MWSGSRWQDNAILRRHAMRDSKFACILEPKKKSPKPIAVRIALCVDVGSSQLSGGSVAPLGGIARVRRKWWSPRRRGWEVWVLDMDLHWGWRLLPLPRHPGHLLQKRRESLTAGFSHRSALQPVTRSPTRPALQAAAPLEHRILSPPPPRVLTRWNLPADTCLSRRCAVHLPF